MLSLQKDITNNRTGHVNRCWVAKRVDSIDLITGEARIRYFGYKDVESYKAGKEEEEIKVVTRNTNNYPKFEELFAQVMMSELADVDGEFYAAEVFNIVDSPDEPEEDTDSEDSSDSSESSFPDDSSDSSEKTAL
jgi:hypothetical protein